MSNLGSHNFSSSSAYRAARGALKTPSLREAEELFADDLAMKGEIVKQIQKTTNRYISAEGIARLAEAGVSSFEEETGHMLPHNLVRTAMSGRVGNVGRYGARLSIEDAEVEISSHARMGGWLKAAARLPAVRKLLCKTQSSRGINSDYTYMSLWAFVARFPSPGALNRKLVAVKSRTEAILTAYEGQKPSWRHLAEALMAEARIGKAAVIVTARTLGWDGDFAWRHDGTGRGDQGPLAKARGCGSWPCAYRKARAWLMARHVSDFPMVTGDGVRTHSVPAYNRHGVSVHRALQTSGGQRKLLWLVRFGGREFLSEGYEMRLKNPETGYYDHIVPTGALSAAFDGLRAFKGRRAQEAHQCTLVGQIELRFNLPKYAKVIVSDDDLVISHSHKARRGCQTFPDFMGTERFSALGDYVTTRKGSAYEEYRHPFHHWGHRELLHGGEVVVVHESRMCGPVDTCTEVGRVVVRSNANPATVLEWLSDHLYP